MVEHVPNTHKVVGSIPTGNILFFFFTSCCFSCCCLVVSCCLWCCVWLSLWHPVFVSHTIVLVLELLLEVVVCFRSANHAYRLLLASLYACCSGASCGGIERAIACIEPGPAHHVGIVGSISIRTAAQRHCGRQQLGRTVGGGCAVESCRRAVGSGGLRAVSRRVTDGRRCTRLERLASRGGGSAVVRLVASAVLVIPEPDRVCKVVLVCVCHERVVLSAMIGG
jgi:uncharacterized protein with PQ loop repeat